MVDRLRRAVSDSPLKTLKSVQVKGMAVCGDAILLTAADALLGRTTIEDACIMETSTIRGMADKEFTAVFGMARSENARESSAKTRMHRFSP